MITFYKQSQFCTGHFSSIVITLFSKFSADQKLELPLQNLFPTWFWVRVGKDQHKEDLEGRRQGGCYARR